MMNNDPKNPSKPCQTYNKSKEEQHVLQMMTWPVQSVDINLVKLVWDWRNKKDRAKQFKSTAHI